MWNQFSSCVIVNRETYQTFFNSTNQMDLKSFKLYVYVFWVVLFAVISASSSSTNRRDFFEVDTYFHNDEDQLYPKF